MSLRIRDDFVQLESEIGSSTAQVVAGGTLTIPSSMPAADRVVKMSATARVKEYWHEEDRVNVEGVVSVNLIYAGQYDQGQAYYGSLQSPEVATFSHFIDIPGTLPGMSSTCTAAVLDLQPTLRSDNRTVDVDFVLEVYGSVVEGKELAYLTDVQLGFPEKLEVTKDTLRLQDVVGTGEARTELKDVLSIPIGGAPPVRVLELVGVFQAAENRAAVDRAAVTGTMSYKALCAVISEQMEEEQLQVYRWDHITRVELNAEIPGSRPGMVIKLDLKEPALINRVINDGQAIAVEGVQEALLKVVQAKDAVVVTNLVPGPDLKLGMREESVTVDQVEDSVSKDLHVNGSVDLPDSKPPLERLLDVEAQAVVTNIALSGGRVNVSGYLDLTALYVARTDDFTQPAYYANWNYAETFETGFSMPALSADTNFEAEAKVLNVQGEPLSRETIGFNVSLKVKCQTKEAVTKSIITEAVELRHFAGRYPTYTSVTIQADDTLWQLATKYGVTTEALIEQNPILAELDDYSVLPVGNKILISKQGSALV